jgi:predicted SprT family Zn-dependent metalloprotease
MDADSIEKIVVHELMHVFLNEMREKGIDHEERVATMLSQAFLWVKESQV